jgi:hypothetical protein
MQIILSSDIISALHWIFGHNDPLLQNLEQLKNYQLFREKDGVKNKSE